MNTFTIITEKMIFGGDCLAKINGKTVFIPGLLPGERAKVSLTEEKRDYSRAQVIEILEKSTHRIEPRCPYYGECGGCNMQHTDGDYQRLLRRQMLEETFSRAGITKDSLPEIEVIYGKEWGYRNRFQLHEGGLMAKKTNRVIPVKDCPIAVPEIRSFMTSNKDQTGRVQIFAHDGNVSTAIVEESRRNGGMPSQKSAEHVIILNGKKILFDVRAFFQSNIDMLEKIIPLICAGLSGKRVADIYSGAGTFSVFLIDVFEETVLVEQNRDALVFAEKNLAESKNRHTCYGISGEKWTTLADSQKHFDAVVIDPPRGGLEKAVRNWLIKVKPPIIRYLSCDPSTMARDAAVLLSGGYRLSKLYMADFYPQTGHIEALGYFELQ